MDIYFLTYGYPIIFLVLVLTGCGLPLPEEVPIIAAGVLCAHGHLNPWVTFVICWVGAVAGDCIMYWAGYHFGRGVFQKHPWWVRFITPEREILIEQKFRQHGLKVFFLARFLVFFRSPLFLSAGILRVSFRRFLVFDAACATVVVGLFFGVSYWLGRELTEWLRQAEFWLTVGVAVLLAGGGLYYGRRCWIRKKRERRGSADDVDRL
ncbi:MAG: DedA family protein [Pirellulales bacterium]|nr:DedA family protein [Pirellulales bacterium]